MMRIILQNSPAILLYVYREATLHGFSQSAVWWASFHLGIFVSVVSSTSGTLPKENGQIQ